jgi:GNAT superfamily N-acetyltransferase
MTSRPQLAIAAIDDLPRIVEMKLAMFSEAGHAALLAPGSAKTILSDYQSMYSQGLARHFVAKVSEEIVGTAGAFLKSDLPFRYFEPPQYGFIGDVYTDPAFRGRGLAKALNNEAIGWLRSQGVTTIRLLASEAGRSLYKNLGFKPSEEMVLTFT